jgi:hypothetical protein
MYTIPDNPDTKKQTGVPFGLVLSPMAEVLPGEYPPPIVNLGELGKMFLHGLTVFHPSLPKHKRLMIFR